MRLLKAERRRAGLGGRELERSTRSVADPQRPHELEAGQPLQILRVPFPQPWVLGLLADDRVLHDGIAEVIDHRRDGEDAAEPLVQTFLRLVQAGCLAWAYAGSAPAKATGAAVSASPMTARRLVRDVDKSCFIGHLLGNGDL